MDRIYVRQKVIKYISYIVLLSVPMSGKAGGTTPFLSLRGLRGKYKLSIPIAGWLELCV